MVLNFVLVMAEICFKLVPGQLAWIREGRIKINKEKFSSVFSPEGRDNHRHCWLYL